MYAPTTRSSHHGLARICAIHAAEMFQSSWTSWSSKIIALETVDSSQRSAGSDQLSWYSAVYSSKSATSLAGGPSSRGRVAISFCVCGDTWSA